MTCRNIDDIISSDPANAVQAPEAVEHLVECKDCRSLMSLLDERGKLGALPEGLIQRIQARIIENLRPVRPLAPSRFFLFACATIFLGVVAIGAMQFGMNGWSALSPAQRVAVFSALTAGAVAQGISTVGQMAPASKYVFAPRTLPIAILVALMLVIAGAFRVHDEPSFVADGLVCLRNGLTYSIPAALLFWLLLRRGAMLYPKLMGAAAGGLGGLAGLSVLEIECPNPNVFHILAWHWGVVLINSVAGVLLGAFLEYVERMRDRREDWRR